MKLNELAPPKGSRRKRKRVGRGPGSGWGTTSGRGDKGQNSRSGGGVPEWFEGGQMPLARRLPKRGFTNIFRHKYAVVNLRDLGRFEADAVVDLAALRRAGLVKGACDGVKVLAQGDLTVSLTLKVDKISAAAKAKVEAAGGSVEVTA
ncbi:MAG: 50S ribosomal protein L15 [Proteobacteria bacterium]|nr:50S ribosomal protein L15 [Pseudomonadota bacterium]MBU1740327.1 50S ribosomal protein L15 [Pseudomonadota bacterium]